MLIRKPVLALVSVVLLLVLGFFLSRTPRVQAAVRAAYVELSIPDAPFRQTQYFNSDGYFGSDSGKTLAITSLTFTSFYSETQNVYVFLPQLLAGTCSSPGYSGNITGGFDVLVPPLATIQLTFPTPLVVPAVSGHACLIAQGFQSQEVTVSGYLE